MSSGLSLRRLCAALALLAAAPVVAAAQTGPTQPATGERPRFMLVVHGGAGTISPTSMTPAMEAEFRSTMTRAIKSGYDVLNGGGVALDAVTAVIHVLEDSPLFNAGKGAVFTHDGKNELDAAIMDGSTLKAGAAAGLTHVRNPIDLARAVMEKSPHVMMIGTGAEAFAKEQGITLVDPKYFWTQHRWDQLQKARAADKAAGKSAMRTGAGTASLRPWEGRYGTVGAVALDSKGNLAAGTSTGGMTDKRWGRVGDAPIVGAGTYANNESCAVSATGSGEYFIRNVVAHDICARVQYKGESVAVAGDAVLNGKLKAQGGDGGVIILDRSGNHAEPFNSEGMYRGWVGPDGQITVKIWTDR